MEEFVTPFPLFKMFYKDFQDVCQIREDGLIGTHILLSQTHCSFFCPFLLEYLKANPRPYVISSVHTSFIVHLFSDLLGAFFKSHDAITIPINIYNHSLILLNS